jgi:PHD/YefM family antitoxin component YafN of YafNO toxin-antitoxin module
MMAGATTLMAEQMKSISEARQNLPYLSLNAQQRMERYVITNQGKPQSVLVGFDDYQKMRAATEILIDPRAKGSIRRGLAEHQAEQRLTVEEVRERLRNRKAVIAGEDQIGAALPGVIEISPEFIPVAEERPLDQGVIVSFEPQSPASPHQEQSATAGE